LSNLIRMPRVQDFLRVFEGGKLIALRCVIYTK
jgi:hypothetical protein